MATEYFCLESRGCQLSRESLLRRRFWQCPKCGRRFSHRNQWHSCVSYSIQDHFRGKPASLKRIFDSLLKELRAYGPVRIDAVKTSINLAGKSHFGGVRVGQDSLNVGFVLHRVVKDKRIVRKLKVDRNKFVHTVNLTRLEDVDAQLLGWLREAYALSRRI